MGEYASGVQRVRLAIDCEFNGKGGELISMALVSEDGREFYEVVGLPEKLQPWVRDNVVPVLMKEPIGFAEFQRRLVAFVSGTRAPEVIADWPVDLAYFANAVIVGEYPNCSAPMFKMQFLNIPGGASLVPHNALEDARGIARVVFARG